MQQLATTVVDYGGGIYAFDQQMVRAFLIVGTKKALLLDTLAQRVDIVPLIRELTDLPTEVVLTHGDGDHLGNLPCFSAAYIHENDMAAVLSHEDCKTMRLLPLAEGDVFDLGGRRLKALYTPGHTKGSVCLLDEENRLLFSGDTVSYGPVFMFGDRRDMPRYRQSLERLRELRDAGAFTTVYCCHNSCPIGADTIDELISCTQGIVDGEIAGAPAAMPFPGGEKPYVCQYGRVSILVPPPDGTDDA